MNQILVEKVWRKLSNAWLSKQFWGEAVTYECLLINHLPFAAIEGIISVEEWFGRLANYYNF